jgi:hypothetical protein
VELSHVSFPKCLANAFGDVFLITH